MNFSVLLPYVSIAIAVATFFIGRLASSHTDGKKAGSLKTDVMYIKESIERIEQQFTNDVNRLEGRADEISAQINNLTGIASAASSATDCAHNRIDEHLIRDHKYFE